MEWGTIASATPCEKWVAPGSLKPDQDRGCQWVCWDIPNPKGALWHFIQISNITHYFVLHAPVSHGRAVKIFVRGCAWRSHAQSTAYSGPEAIQESLHFFPQVSVHLYPWASANRLLKDDCHSIISSRYGKRWENCNWNCSRNPSNQRQCLYRWKCRL